MLRWALLPFLVLSMGCLPHTGVLPSGAPDETYDDLREAVLRHYLLHGPYGGPLMASGEIPCIRVEGNHDPSAALLARLRAVHPGVTVGSACENRQPGIHVKATGQSALFLYVHSVDPKARRIEGGCYCGDLCSMSGEFELFRASGRWEVRRRPGSIEWVSERDVGVSSY